MRHGVVFSSPSHPFAVLEDMVGGIHQESERGLENLVDFVLVDLQREGRLDQRDQGRNAKSGAGKERVNPAEGLHEPLLEADFLVRLAQSGIAWSLASVDLATGK